MLKTDETYLNFLQRILSIGSERLDRTGIGTRSIFGPQMRFDLSDHFPLLISKKVNFKQIKSELLWFLEGSTDERRLAEIHYGAPRNELTDKTTIWTANAQADYWKNNAEFDGDLGKIYGYSWRNYGGEVDQIANVIDSLINDPYSRRHIVVAYDPTQVNKVSLPPCHSLFQFYVDKESQKLSCHLYQRSGDAFLGVPYNIASYALLTHMIAQVTGYRVGEFIHTFGDAHLYQNHYDAARQQILNYDPYCERPQLELDKSIKNINDFKMNHIRIKNYKPQNVIRAPMAV